MKLEYDDINLAPFIAIFPGVLTRILLACCDVVSCDLHPKAIIARIIAAIFLVVLYFTLVLPGLSTVPWLSFLLNPGPQFGIGVLIGFLALEIIPIGGRFLKKQVEETLGVKADELEISRKHDMVESS